MWEISENLHRAELPQVERDKLVAEWCRLVGRDEVLAQVAPKVQNGRPKGGEREAARQLGLDRDDVRRAAKVASITPEAQQAAHEVGNRWASLIPCRAEVRVPQPVGATSLACGEWCGEE